MGFEVVCIEDNNMVFYFVLHSNFNNNDLDINNLLLLIIKTILILQTKHFMTNNLKSLDI